MHTRRQAPVLDDEAEVGEKRLRTPDYNFFTSWFLVGGWGVARQGYVCIW